MMTATDEERRPMLKGRSVYESNDDKNDDDFDAGDGDGDDTTSYLDHQGERRSVGMPCKSAASPTRVPAATASNVSAAAAAAAAPSPHPNPNPHPVSSKGSSSSPLHSSPGSDPTTTVEVYLHQFQVRAVECVANAYDRSNCVSRTRANGALGTSLPEDVVFLFETQLSVLQEYLRNQPAASSTLCPGTTIARIDDDNNTANHEPSSLWETPRGQELYCDATLAILECLIHTQKCVRPVFLSTLEHCCEAANDFVRLSDKMEQLLASFEFAQAKDHDDKSDGSGPGRVGAAWNEYVALLAQDAVGAAERTHVFVIRDFVAWHQHGRYRRRHSPRYSNNKNSNNMTTPATLFSYQWEVECTSNEIITSLLEDVCDRDYWSRIRRYLDADVLRNKALVALCRAVVCYYVRCLVERADSAVRGRHPNHQMLRRRAKEVLGMSQRLRGRQGAHPGGMGGGGCGGFLHSGRALRRMKDDIAIIKQYFVSKAHGNTTLTRILSNEVYILELIHECLEAASDLGHDEDRDGGGGGNHNSNDSDHLFLDSFIVVIHKRTGGDALVTRHFVGDLFWLVNHQERPLQLTVLQQDLHLVTMRMEEVKRSKDGGGDPKNAAKNKAPAELSLVSVDQMLRAMYEDRIVQGMLPLCWTCLPKVEAGDGGMELVSAKIREITRGVADLRMKRKSSF
jgi:hypothetical protein